MSPSAAPPTYTACPAAPIACSALLARTSPSAVAMCAFPAHLVSRIPHCMRFSLFLARSLNLVSMHVHVLPCVSSANFCTRSRDTHQEPLHSRITLTACTGIAGMKPSLKPAPLAPVCTQARTA